MTLFDRGSGPPLIVVPGIQGRCEWFAPALRALSAHCRTLAYTLCGDFGSGRRYDRARGFDNYVAQLDDVFERAGVEQAALCGISYGGFVALRYAAARPGRVSALVFASSPAPGWVPTERIRFAAEHGARAVWYPMIPSLMAERVRMQQALDLAPDCCDLRMPALVITGEPHLDRVVPVATTRRYLELIPHARYAMVERTGHLGSVTRPREFAAIVGEFLNDATD